MEPEDAAVQMPVQDEPAAFEGYDFEFVDELSPQQICSICLVTMRNPVQTVVCGHRFCRDCLVGTFREGHLPACPQCRTPIPEEGGFYRDQAWERDILSLRVKCKMNERGCEWIGELLHYQSHSDECNYEDVTCGGCHEEMQRRFLDTHSILECRERIVQCGYCKDEFAFRSLELHQSAECTRFPLACLCGVQDIPREEMESHVQDDCSMTMVICPYVGAGCTFYDKRANLKAHIEESSEVHLRITWSAFLNAKHELGEVKGQVEETAIRVNTLRSEKEEIEICLQRTNQEFGELKLSERKLEEENLSLIKEVTVLGQELTKVKEKATTANRELKGLEKVKGQVEETAIRVNTLQSEKEEIKMCLQKARLSERKLEVENLSLKNEVTELGQELTKVKERATTANTALKGLEKVKGQVEETEIRVNTLQSEKKDIKMCLQRTNQGFRELKQSERKLEEENLSLKKLVTELGQELTKVKERATTANTALKGLEKVTEVMQRKLEALEKKETNVKQPIINQKLVMPDEPIHNAVPRIHRKNDLSDLLVRYDEPSLSSLEREQHEKPRKRGYGRQTEQCELSWFLEFDTN